MGASDNLPLTLHLLCVQYCEDFWGVTLIQIFHQDQTFDITHDVSSMIEKSTLVRFNSNITNTSNIAENLVKFRLRNANISGFSEGKISPNIYGLITKNDATSTTWSTW